jgi:hypothetical protein
MVGAKADTNGHEPNLSGGRQKIPARGEWSRAADPRDPFNQFSSVRSAFPT